MKKQNTDRANNNSGESQALSGQRILVTGGAGFIGSHVVDHLLMEGAQLIVVDNLTSSVATVGLLESWENAGTEIHSCSVSDYCHSSESVDYIIHLASIVGPLGVLGKVGRIASEIIESSLKMARLAIKHRAQLLFVSTSEIFGVPGRLDEESPCFFPASECSARREYAQSKLLAETVIQNLGSHGLRYQIVRPFNVTGPRQSPQGGFVLPRFVIQALSGLPITVYGHGLQSRAFTNVVDIVHGLMKILQRSESSVWNLGNESNKVTIGELAAQVVAQCPSEIMYVDPRILHGGSFAEAGDKIPNADKAQRLLGWSPCFDVHSTVAATLTYWRNNSALNHWAAILEKESKISSQTSKANLVADGIGSQ